MRPLAIETFAARSFRNLASVSIEPSPHFNVVSGDNGQGKTSLLEAIYVACTSRSFRAARMNEIVAHGEEVASVRAKIREAGDDREQSVGLRGGSRVVRIDGKRPTTLAEYAVRTPAVAFHPGLLELSMGSGAERRRMLDRIALYVSPGSLAVAAAYTRAMRERQRTLEVRGVVAADLDDWEVLVARHGTALSDARQNASNLLAAEASKVFDSIGPAGARFDVRFSRSAPDDEDRFRSELATRRIADVKRRAASVGPHRDDLRLELGGHAMRGFASQGQHRAAVLALELAEIEVVAQSRGTRPILLLDDVSSELDLQRTTALLTFVREQEGQVFLTTTRPDLIDSSLFAASAERRDFRVLAGQIDAAAR
jgi:DNA replication and repair protein RecF